MRVRSWVAVLGLLACDDGSSGGGGGEGGAPPDPMMDAAVTVDMAVRPDAAAVDMQVAVDMAPDMPIEADSGIEADASVLPGACGGEWARFPVEMPLGETLFFDGDDYLAMFDDGRDCPVVVLAPDGGTAEAIDGRLTPDIPGEWILTRGNQRVHLDVRADFLNSDTFQNYNYTPVNAIAALDGDTIAVVSPPSNAVHLVGLGADGATPGTLVPTGAWPTSVALWPESGYALVAQTGRDSLGFLDLATERVVDAIKVGDEPAGIVVSGDTAFITLSGEDRVARVDLTTREVTATLAVGHDPRAMALSPDGRTLYVAALMSFNAHRLGPSGGPTEPELQRDVTIIDVETFTETGVIPEIGTMIRGLHVTADNRLIAGVSHSHNDRAEVDADSDPHSHGIAVVDLSAEPFAVEQIDLDRALPSASPFTLAPSPDGQHLLVSLSASKAIIALDAQTFDEVVRMPTGNDPRGLVFAHGRVWTTSWLDNLVEGHPWPAVLGAEMVSVEVGDDPTPPDIKAGQRIFNDATFSRYGKFSCNNCHIDGLTDGLVWDLLVDGEVNTLAFRNVAGTDPFLWGGQLPTLFDFSREVLRLVGGNASGQQMEQLTLYMQSITAPPNPFARPGGKYTEAALRGRALFDNEAGCAACHSGAQFTNRQIVPGKTEGTQTDVPGLIGVYDTMPYGREAQWPTLEGILDRALEYTDATDLSVEQKADILAYLQQIPGDALWLNSARPLSGSDHVWTETPIELTFSHRLAPGQIDNFKFATADGQRYPGEWQVNGRIARFIPEDVLPNETAFVVEVHAPLKGALGQVMDERLRLEWTTGGVPETDISGRHLVTLQTAVFGIEPDPTAEVAALQSSGGNVTGVLYGVDDLLELSHVEGVVSGTRVELEPFLFDTEFGQFQVEAAWLELEDEDGDGFADRGEGTVSVLGFDVGWTVVRLELPPDAGE